MNKIENFLQKSMDKFSFSKAESILSILVVTTLIVMGIGNAIATCMDMMP